MKYNCDMIKYIKFINKNSIKSKEKKNNYSSISEKTYVRLLKQKITIDLIYHGSTL